VWKRGRWWRQGTREEVQKTREERIKEEGR
jgi:hypothetical protein